MFRILLRKWVVLGILFILLCVSQNIFAQEGDLAEYFVVPENEVLQLESVEVESESVEVVSGLSAHSLFGAPSMESALQAESGVSLRRVGTALHEQSLSLRGSTAEGVLVILNRTPLNAFSHGKAELAFLPYYAMDNPGDFSILMNSGGTIYGSGALGGVLKLSTMSEFLEVNEQNSSDNISARLYAGNMSQFGIHGVYKKRRETTLLEASFFADSTDGAFDFEDEQGELLRRRHNGAYRLGGNFSIQKRFVGGMFDMSHVSSAINREIAGPSEFPYYYKDAYSKHYLGVSNAHYLSDAIELSPLHQLIVEGNISHRILINEYNNPTTLLGNKPYYSEYIENGLFSEAGLHLFYGFRSETSFAIGYQFGLLNRLGETLGNNSEHKLYAYILEKLHFWEDRLLLDMGLRLEAVLPKTPNLLPHFRLAIKPHRRIALEGSIGYAYREPSFDEKYIQTEFVKGNPLLKAQRTLQSELDYIYTIIDSLEWKGALFWNTHWDLIRFLPVSAHLYSAKNLGKVTSRGVETSLKYQYLSYFGLSFGYTFTDSFLHSEEPCRIPDIPRHRIVAQIWGSYSYFQGGVSMHYTLDTPLDLYGHKRKTNPLYIDAQIKLLPHRNINITLVIKNLLNARNYSDILQFPLPGLTAMLMFDLVQFGL